MKKAAESGSNFKENNKGFTLIELLIVVAMIVALTSVATGSFVALSHARSNKAANSLESLIAQSKVNALSGQDNVLILQYDDEEDCYVAGLYNRRTDSNTGTVTIDSNYYDSFELGNSLLKIELENKNGTRTALSDDGSDKLQLRFNGKNGRLEYCWIKSADGAEENTDHTSTPNDCKIYITFGSSNCVEIWKLTGEHHIVGQDA